LLTGLKEFNLLIPWPYTGTNVVVELNWKSRKNKKNEKTVFCDKYCFPILLYHFCLRFSKCFDFQGLICRLSILLETSKLTFAVIPSPDSYLVKHAKDIFANVSVSIQNCPY
jgi:hypothetical protein